ncbi:MAG: hypothetical protein O3B01_00510 [Planctomycetota bacterium]|nr:hypothetical protein [Planctomycetota bacterium]MDA1137035.1 hypothetical protein [Planctomycetota bacterium]
MSLKHIAFAFALFLFVELHVSAELVIVKDGQPRAEIIIDEKAQRATRLAAQELQTYVKKITGAGLSIGAKPTGDMAVKIYIGQSPHTEKLGITARGLEHGAYRIVSGEDLSNWPFWQNGEGAFARARAYVGLKAGKKAETDLQMALAYTSATRPRISILATMADNREMNLKDDDAALEAYRQNFESKETIGAADEFRSLQGAARILTRRGKFDEALAVLNRAAIESQKGYWRHAMLLSLGETLTAAGRKSDALRAYRSVQEDESALKSHRDAAAKAIKLVE